LKGPVLYSHNILPVQANDDDQSTTTAAGESFLGGQANNAMPFLRPQLASHLVNRGVLIVKVCAMPVHGV